MSATGPRVSFTVRFDHKVKVWVLLHGGWLPLQFAAVDVLVIDRNIVSALRALQRQPTRPDLVADSWWLQHLDKPSPALNPVLCAMEGRWRSAPTFNQFCDELEEACTFLESVLPKACVLRQKPEHLQNVFEVFTSQLPRLHKETEFLLAVCPLISSRVPAGKERPVEQAILEAADSRGLSRQAICCIAALSTLYERVDGDEPRIGRGVLKPTLSYTDEDAFNAIADLRALEFLAAGCALNGFSSGICTRDKYLAALWVKLGVHSSSWENNSFTATYTPSADLFPRLGEEEFTNLFARVKSDA